MICINCSNDFVGRRCPNCGALPPEHAKKNPSLGDILYSRKFVRRFFTDQKKIRLSGDDKPWNEW